MGRVVRRRARSGRELLLALVLFTMVEVGVRYVPLPRLARWLSIGFAETSRPPASPAPLVLPWWTKQRLDAVARVGRHWPAGPEGKCLRAALVGGQRLRSLDPELVIGVNRTSGRVAAHAWLEVAGVSLDSGAEQYMRMGQG